MMSDFLFYFNDLPFLAVLCAKWTVLLGIAWIGIMMFNRQNPAFRLLLLRSALVAVFLLPVIQHWVPGIGIPLPAITHSSEEAGMFNAIPALSTSTAEQNAGKALDEAIMPSAPRQTETEMAVISPPTVLASKGIGLNWKIVGMVWMLGCFVAGLWMLYQVWRIERIVKQSSPAPAFAMRLFEQIRDEMGIQKPIAVRSLEQALTPFLLGIVQPKIIIPPRLLEDEYKNDLTSVLAHELSHVRTNDLIWKYGFRCMQILLWFHPFAWLLRKAHDMVCEELSDAKAAIYIGDAEEYSITLARVTLELLMNPPVVAGLSMAKLPEIRQRLELLKHRIAFAPLSRGFTHTFIVMGLAFLVVLAGFQVEQAESARSLTGETAFFQPLQTGEKWIYSHIGCRTAGSRVGQPIQGDRIREVVGTTIMDGKHRTLIQETWGDDDFNSLRMFLDNDRLVYRMEEGASIMTFEPAVEFDWINLPPGGATEVETIARDEVHDGVFTMQACRLEDETIRVPAGTFENCQKIELVISYTSPTQSEPQACGYYEKWYHPHVNGLVKEVAVFESFAKTDLHLPIQGRINSIVQGIKRMLLEGGTKNSVKGTSMLKAYVPPKS